MKKLKLTFQNHSFTARLLEKEAPGTVAAIEAACPFRSRLSYAKIGDREIVCQTPAFFDEVENPVNPGAGDVVFYGPRQSLCVFYDRLEPLFYVNRFAVVEPEDLPALKQAADSVWAHPGEILRVEIVDV